MLHMLLINWSMAIEFSLSLANTFNTMALFPQNSLSLTPVCLLSCYSNDVPPVCVSFMPSLRCVVNEFSSYGGVPPIYCCKLLYICQVRPGWKVTRVVTKLWSQFTWGINCMSLHALFTCSTSSTSAMANYTVAHLFQPITCSAQSFVTTLGCPFLIAVLFILVFCSGQWTFVPKVKH